MNNFTVCLFGHREINDLRKLNNGICAVINELMHEKEHLTFLIGRSGEFDEFATSVIKYRQRVLGKDKSDLILVLAYATKAMERYEEYYDDIIIPDCLYHAHPKAMITLRNRWMIEHSDLVIVYVDRKKGGAYSAMCYAQRLNKRVVNLFEQESIYPQE